MSASDDVRESLRAASDFLTKTPNASKRLLFVAKAFDEYLAGKHTSLDIALGLKLGRGKYIRPENEEHIKMIYNAVFDHINGKAFNTIAELNGYEAKEFKCLYDRYKHHAIERLANEIKVIDLLDF